MCPARCGDPRTLSRTTNANLDCAFVKKMHFFSLFPKLGGLSPHCTPPLRPSWWWRDSQPRSIYVTFFPFAVHCNLRLPCRQSMTPPKMIFIRDRFTFSEVLQFRFVQTHCCYRYPFLNQNYLSILFLDIDIPFGISDQIEYPIKIFTGLLCIH